MEPDVKPDTPGVTPGTTGDTTGSADVLGDVSSETRRSTYGTDSAAYSATDSATGIGSTDAVSASGDVGETKEQWQKIGEQTSTFLSELPSYISEFFGQYRRPIITIGLILGTILAVKIALAILDAINDIPLLAPTFELIGIAYSIWFVYRYLLKASDRAELSEDFSALKSQVLGGKDRLLDRFSSEDKLSS